MQAVAFAYNTTPHVAAGFPPFFLEHGREATLPLHRELEEPRLDAVAASWLQARWEARRLVRAAHLDEMGARQRIIESKQIPVGWWVAVRLSKFERRDCPAKFAPAWGGPWLVCERLPNGVSYKLRHVVYNFERTVPLRKLKLLHTPAQRAEIEKNGLLPHEPVAFGVPLDEQRTYAQFMGPPMEPIATWLDESVQSSPPEVESAGPQEEEDEDSLEPPAEEDWQEAVLGQQTK